MKKLQFICVGILVFLVFTVACSNENEEKINVSVQKVNVRENLEQAIDISGGTGTYSCEVDDNEIATAKISGQKLSITGHSTGTTHVTIKDEANNSVTIIVKVLHQKITFEITKLESAIEAGKNDYNNLIMEELQECFPFPVGTIFELIIKSENYPPVAPGTIKGDLFIYYNTKGEPFNGTFKLYGEQLTFSNLDQEFDFQLAKENSFLREDFTKHYKVKYPEADIRYVYNEQVLKVLSGEL